MNVLTDYELHRMQVGSFLRGASAMIAVSAAAALYLWLNQPAPPLDAPQIVSQTPNQTVARIPTLHAGVRVDCTVTINQSQNVWSITC